MMPVSDPHPRSHGHRRVEVSTRRGAPPNNPNQCDSCSRESAMDVPDRAEQEPEAISVARCRELLGEDANTLTDDEVLAVARHAEALAQIMIDLALQDVRIH
jgi:hypothetical protein